MHSNGSACTLFDYVQGTVQDYDKNQHILVLGELQHSSHDKQRHNMKEGNGSFSPDRGFVTCRYAHSAEQDRDQYNVTQTENVVTPEAREHLFNSQANKEDRSPYP